MNKRIGLYVSFLLLLFFSVYADNYVKINFNPSSIANAKVKGFVCPNSNCFTVVGDLWSGNTLTSDVGSFILRFPASIPYGGTNYVHYYYHLNYLPYYIINVATDTNNPGTTLENPYVLTRKVEFTKISSCSSPVSLSVVNNIRENLPVSVTSGAEMSSTTKSAFGFQSDVYNGFIRGSEFEQYYEVETTLRLRIYKYNSTTSKNIGSPIHSENIVKRIYYDDTVNVAFTDWMPPEQIDQFTWYNITVVSDVTDSKCSSKVNQRASKLLRVWRDDPRNECYSLIDTEGLVFSPVDLTNGQPEVGQEVTITFRKLSNYANDYEPWDPLFTLTPQDTNINLKLKEQDSPDVVITKTLPKNSDDNFKDVSVTWTPEKAGLFTMELYADAATCPVSEDTTSDIYSQTLTVFEIPKYDLKFVVKSAGNPVADAKLLIENPLLEKLTSPLGVATINLQRGTYGYRVEKSPYTGA